LHGIEQIGEQNNRLLAGPVECQATHVAPLFGLLTPQPPPVLLPDPALGILAALRRTRSIGREGSLGMVAHEKMVVSGRKCRGLREITKLPIRHPESAPAYLLSHLG